MASPSDSIEREKRTESQTLPAFKIQAKRRRSRGGEYNLEVYRAANERQSRIKKCIVFNLRQTTAG